MSLKPVKESDLRKSWMRKRTGSRVAISPEYHLIITEGTKTEPGYFEGLRDAINSRFRGRIQLDIEGTGMNTMSILERTIQLVRKSPNPYRHVWIVYDTDDFPADRVDAVVHECLRLSSSEVTYHAIWSNQCIELWFLLHFSYMHSDLSRNLYFSKLSDRLIRNGYGVYEKNRKDIFSVLRPYMKDALSNARKLDAANNGRLPSSAAPGTKVHELIGKLMAYL